MSRFTKPKTEKITQFMNESDAELAYRLQNEEFKNMYEKKNSDKNKEIQTGMTPTAATTSTQSPRPSHPGQILEHENNIALTPRKSTETNINNIDSPGAIIFTDGETANRYFKKTTSSTPPDQNSPNAKSEVSPQPLSQTQDQLDQDLLLAKKLQAIEDEKYKKRAEKQKKYLKERDQRQQKFIQKSGVAPNHTLTNPDQNQQYNSNVQNRNIAEDGPNNVGPQNPLFKHAENQLTTNVNVLGFSQHGPSTSTKIPGHENHKHTEIGEITRALPLPTQQMPITSKPVAAFKNSRTPTPNNEFVYDHKDPREDLLDKTQSQSTTKEDEILALKLHRAEIISANKHIKSDKTQIIERIKEDRKNEQIRQKKRDAHGQQTSFRGSPSAVSLEDADLNYQNPAVNSAQVVYYPPHQQ